MKITMRRAVGTAVAGAALTAGGVAVQQRGCSDADCARLAAAVTSICQAAPVSKACEDAQDQYKASCAVTPPPPTPEPPSCDPSPCDPAETCLPLPSGIECRPPDPVCEVGASCGCWHRPPGEAWQELPSCTAPTPGPTAPPTPKPPTPPPTVHAPLLDDEDLTLVASDTRKQTWAYTAAAIDRWRAKNPEAWRGDGACLRDGPSGIDTAFQGISDELLAVDVVAGQSIDDNGKRSDCIFVNRPGTNEYEETHLFDYARACVATSANAIKHMYVRGTAPPPTPPPPPATDECPFLPCPMRTYSNGTPRWRFNSREYSRKIADTTPVTVDQEPFCAATGQSPTEDGTKRAGCPMRKDKEGDLERPAVERWLLKGDPVTDAKNGARCEQVEGNPFQLYRNNGNCRLCEPGRNVCTSWW